MMTIEDRREFYKALLKRLTRKQRLEWETEHVPYLKQRDIPPYEWTHRLEVFCSPNEVKHFEIALAEFCLRHDYDIPPFVEDLSEYAVFKALNYYIEDFLETPLVGKSYNLIHFLKQSERKKENASD